MGKGPGDSERLLARLSPGTAAASPAGWSDGDGDPPRVGPGADQEVDPFPAGTGDGRGRRRHVDADPGAQGTGWRASGVPPGLAVLVAVVAVVGVVMLLGGGGGSEEVLVGPTTAVVEMGTAPAVDVADPGPVDRADDAGTDPEPGAAADTAPLLVHVDGAVARPGVVELPPGARVADAVQAAGGATDEADTRLVNLARPLTDGELVVVPRPGEQVAAPGLVGASRSAAPGAGPGAAPGSGPPVAGGPVDLNTADAAALDELPGIGPVLAERIVAWREESGPFTTVDDLTAVSGIGPAVLSDVRDLVTV